MSEITAVEYETDLVLAGFRDDVESWIARAGSRGWERFRGGNFERVVRRAYRIMVKARDHHQEKTGRSLGTDAQFQLAALVVGEFHEWKHCPRRGRAEDHPRTQGQFTEKWGIEQRRLSTILWLSRYPRWEHRYIVEETRETRVARTKAALHETVDDLMECPAPTRNAQVFKVALEAEGAIEKTPAVTFNDNRRQLVVGLSADQQTKLLKDVARMAKEVGLLDEGVHDEIPLAEVAGAPDHEHAGEDQALPRDEPSRPRHLQQPPG